MSVRCPRNGPPDFCPTVFIEAGVLTAHLVKAHLVSASEALPQARKLFAAADPFGLDKHGITKAEPADAVDVHPTSPHPRIQAERAADPRCGNELKEDPMAKTRTVKPCTKCGQVGHRSDSKACPGKPTGGGSASKTRAATPSRNGTSAKALVAQMDELIATKRRELDQLASARDILARACQTGASSRS